MRKLSLPWWVYLKNKKLWHHLNTKYNYYYDSSDGASDSDNSDGNAKVIKLSCFENSSIIIIKITCYTQALLLKLLKILIIISNY